MKSSKSSRRSRGWAVALAVSLGVHVGTAVLIYGLAHSAGAGDAVDEPLPLPPRGSSPLVPPTPAAEARTDVEIRELPFVDPATIVHPWDARPGEQDRAVPRTTAPADADGRRRAAPAADRGSQGGAPPDHAFRLDRSTMRARLTDGATEAQPSDSPTARLAASPQAIRREPTVGIGDAERSSTPTRVPAPAPPPAARLALGGEPAAAGPSEHPVAPPAELPPVAARVDFRSRPMHAVGPLDAEPGARSFDVEPPGRPADDRLTRAASNEAHPGLIDYSRASAPRALVAPDGRGPAESPGAVARPAAGSAPAAYGARDPQAASPTVSERTLDRRYDHYVQEISQRVNRIRDFPKALALRLEQGETIVRFVVGVYGRLGEGPQVVKTSGFEEFDAAAVRAVVRAAPFPPMPNPGAARPLPVSLRVTFDNPVVR